MINASRSALAIRQQVSPGSKIGFSIGALVKSCGDTVTTG